MLHGLKGQLLICAIFTLCFFPAILAVVISSNLETINARIQTTPLKDNILLLSELAPSSRTAIENKLKEGTGTEVGTSLRQDGVKSHIIKGLELSVSWLWFESKVPIVKNEDTLKNQEIGKITLLPASAYSNQVQFGQSLLNSDANKVTVPLLYNSYLSKIATTSKNWSIIQADMNNTLNKTFPVYSSPLLTTNKAKQLNPNFEISFAGFGGGSSTSFGLLTNNLQQKLQEIGTEDVTLNSVSALEFDSQDSMRNFINKYGLEYDKYEDKITQLLGVVNFASSTIFLIALIILVLISTRDLLGSKVDLAMFSAMGINRLSLITMYINNYAILSIISLIISSFLSGLIMLYLGNYSNLYFDLFGSLITNPGTISYINIFSTDYLKLTSSLLAAFGVTLLPFMLIVLFTQKLNIISTLK